MNTTNMEYRKISAEEAKKDNDYLAELIKAAGINYKLIVVIANGGYNVIYPIAIKYDKAATDSITIRASHYDKNGNRLKEVVIYNSPRRDEAENILVVDDIYDDGRTFEAFREIFPNADYAVVYIKNNINNGHRKWVTFHTKILPGINSAGRKIFYQFPWEKWNGNEEER